MSELTNDQKRMMMILKETGKVTVRISCYFVPRFKDGKGKIIPHYRVDSSGKAKETCHIAVKFFEELVALGLVRSVEMRDWNERGLEYKKSRVYTLTASGMEKSLGE